MAIIIYKDNNTKRNSWIRYLHTRVFRKNQNNLISIIGKTGSGKTYSGMAICEILSKENKTYFGIENIVFSLLDLMKLINSGNLTKGSCIIFDEPQVSISNRDYQTKANKVFNYLVTTFRHQNLSLFFCTPYEDLLDLSTRKLFHAKFETQNIDMNKKVVILKPKIMEYNSHKKKFYEKYLRACYKPKDSQKFITTKIEYWEVPKPSQKLIDFYERKKKEFTFNLNKNIQLDLEKYENKNNPMNKNIIRSTTKGIEAIALLERLGSVKMVAKALNITPQAVYLRLKQENKQNLNKNGHFSLENEVFKVKNPIQEPV